MNTDTPTDELGTRPKKRAARQRHAYAKDAADYHSRITVTIDLLEEALAATDPTVVPALIRVSLKRLKGE